ncbi:unnamed protein product [Cuscuta campestris]|uniref:Aminotransferase-like plant mobile domain-containing protein n=1 Tax=Cuscuta campestris TaxID=132261 RepID=A0A484LTJ4_9ASTE|nr:unnamed protein product [Cuscuta campestris]
MVRGDGPRLLVTLSPCGLLFPDTSGRFAPTDFVLFLDDFDRTSQYSWGLAVLAQLYNSLCRTALKKNDRTRPGGCLLLLQLWAWSRLLPIRPKVKIQANYRHGPPAIDEPHGSDLQKFTLVQPDRVFVISETNLMVYCIIINLSWDLFFDKAQVLGLLEIYVCDNTRRDDVGPSRLPQRSIPVPAADDNIDNPNTDDESEYSDSDVDETEEGWISQMEAIAAQAKRYYTSDVPLEIGLQFCLPLVTVDGTHLYGKYKGHLLLAVEMNGNRELFPIAYAVVDGETCESWAWFLRLRVQIKGLFVLCKYVSFQIGMLELSTRIEIFLNFKQEE